MGSLSPNKLPCGGASHHHVTYKRRIVRGAMSEEYVILNKVNPKTLIVSQKNLLIKRRAIWGRLLTMKAFGIPTPRLQGFSLFKNWLHLPIKEKLRSVLGTAGRVIQRKYCKSKRSEQSDLHDLLALRKKREILL